MKAIMKTILFLAVGLGVSVAFLVKAQNFHSVSFEAETDVSDVHRDAAKILFDGFRPAFKEAFASTTGDQQIDPSYTITFALTARNNYLDPQYIVLFVSRADGAPREVYKFKLGLETDLSKEAAAGVEKLMVVVDPRLAGNRP